MHEHKETPLIRSPSIDVSPASRDEAGANQRAAAGERWLVFTAAEEEDDDEEEANKSEAKPVEPEMASGSHGGA